MIRFKCPHCKKTLGVKDHLAGKKAACPVCKKALKIPAPVPAPAADVESLAAAAFTEAPAAPAPAPAQAKPIAFTCSFCDAEVSVAAELAGKQTPCPECKRIVKVPKPVEDKPKDWRTADVRNVPSFARQAEPQAPDGAWAPATARKVSQQALAEAGAVPDIDVEPVGVLGWIRRAAYATAVVAVVAVAWVGWNSFRQERNLRAGLARMLESVEPTSKLSPEATAAIYRVAGEFFSRKPDPKKANEYFNKCGAGAMRLAGNGPTAVERDALLLDLACTQVDLGGTAKDKDEGKSLGWESTQKELERTLLRINAREARAVALREVITRLMSKGKEVEPVALGLAIKVGAGGGKGEEPIVTQQLALLEALGKDQEAGEMLKHLAGEEGNDLLDRLVRAEGLARQGKFAEACKVAGKEGLPQHQLQALLVVSAIAVADKAPSARTQNSRDCLERAFKLAEEELKKGRKVPVWDLIQLGRVAARAGLDDRIPSLLAKLPDKSARGRVQLEGVLVKLEGTPGAVDPATWTLPDKDSLGHGLALEAIARHNSRVASPSTTLALLEGLEENWRPFVHAGVALGEQDAAHR
jgi:hypothetical protein